MYFHNLDKTPVNGTQRYFNLLSRLAVFWFNAILLFSLATVTENLADKSNAFTRKARKMVLLPSILIFKLNHKNYERVNDDKWGREEKYFAHFSLFLYRRMVRFLFPLYWVRDIGKTWIFCKSLSWYLMKQELLSVCGNLRQIFRLPRNTEG